jgi:hypothetical protein
MRASPLSLKPNKLDEQSGLKHIYKRDTFHNALDHVVSVVLNHPTSNYRDIKT